MSNISDDKKLINVRKEFNELKPLAKLLFEKFKDELLSKYKELALINSQLWKIEDDIRECEKNKNFGEKFVELARAVYFTNDKRSDVKKQINILTGSGFIEEKSYEDYE
jgi:hypothetical protein